MGNQKNGGEGRGDSPKNGMDIIAGESRVVLHSPGCFLHLPLSLRNTSIKLIITGGKTSNSYILGKQGVLIFMLHIVN